MSNAAQNAVLDPSEDKGDKFDPVPEDGSKPDFASPEEQWQTMLSSTCNFSVDIFDKVMLNLIKNPNIMSSHLFRADIFYDSDTDSSTLLPEEGSSVRSLQTSKYIQHMNKDYRPIDLKMSGFDWQRTFVRNMVPRNRQLDRPMVQTCHIFTTSNTEASKAEHLVVYVPHIASPDEMPWYHPIVKMLAFTYTPSLTAPPTNAQSPSDCISSKISIHILSFASCPLSALQPRLDRTCLKLLSTMHKHCRGQAQGYQKRVHHDQVVPQRAFQETYARLKETYARQLSQDWVEVTDPTKHVFEDLGIASFLIEVWREMYDVDSLPGGGQHDETIERYYDATVNGNGDVNNTKASDDENQEKNASTAVAKAKAKKPAFPGFVDIGCGNGVLVYILLSEGYEGWGFDARSRKTWKIFSSHVQDRLKQMILVPSILHASAQPPPPPASSTDSPATSIGTTNGVASSVPFHDGIFEPGTFIVSNHADELTPWTPLLAHLNQSPFIAIPCCSHDLAGRRFRAPEKTRLQQQQSIPKGRSQPEPRPPAQPPLQAGHSHDRDNAIRTQQAAETGSLARRSKPSTPPSPSPSPFPGTDQQPIVSATSAKGTAKNQMPSAYASLCTYISALTAEIGYISEKEMLRIPSTRNTCVLGRRRKPDSNFVGTSDVSVAVNDEGKGEDQDRNNTQDHDHDDDQEAVKEYKDQDEEHSMARRSLATNLLVKDNGQEDRPDLKHQLGKGEEPERRRETLRCRREVDVKELVVREPGMSIDDIRRDWVERARSIAGKVGEGH